VGTTGNKKDLKTRALQVEKENWFGKKEGVTGKWGRICVVDVEAS